MKNMTILGYTIFTIKNLAANLQVACLFEVMAVQR